jgi:hypothetical protein
MPKFEVKVSKRDSQSPDNWGTTESQKCKSVIECGDTPELLSRDGRLSIPLSCRAARRPGEDRRS